MLVAVADNGGVKLIDLTDIFCGPTTCHTVIGGLIDHFDSHHMTATFSRTLSGFLGDQIVADLKAT
jgi:hypothetical protein